MYRLRMAESVQDMQLIAAEEIDPDDVDALAALAGLESTSRARGDTGLADRFKALIEFSRLSKTGAVFSLPDVPGAAEAAAEVQGLFHADKNEPLPLPQTESFFPVLASFKAQAEEKGLLELAAGLADLEQRAQDTFTSRAEQLLPPLAHSMFDWIEASDWRQSQLYLQDHQELLCDEVATLLAQLSDAAQAPDQADALEVLAQHRSLLEHARHAGIEAAYAGMIDGDGSDIEGTR